MKKRKKSSSKKEGGEEGGPYKQRPVRLLYHFSLSIS